MTPTKQGSSIFLDNILPSSRSRSAGRQSIATMSSGPSSTSKSKIKIGQQSKRRRTGDFEMDDQENYNNFKDNGGGHTITFGMKSREKRNTRRSVLFGKENTLSTLNE